MNHVLSTVILTVIKILYSICIVCLSIYGFNSLVLAILYIFTKRRAFPPAQKLPRLADYPRVTIQLPLFNESTIVDRLLDSVTSQDYPRDRYEIQVLDDSTDETTEIARQLVDQYAERGWNIHLIHRDDRTGYKAGALANGLKSATGDYLAIFDADFVPPSDWLRCMIAEFTDAGIGCVQSRWEHLNPKYNLITNAEMLGLDAHFMVEQNARARTGLFLGFNGSGGIWCKQCIIDAGGWASDTLTEDLDLSYRAQLKGWKIKYQPSVVVPGELPAQIDAFKNQQYRWAKGSAQTFRKLASRVLHADVPWYKKVMGLIHLAMYMPFPFMVGVMLLTLPIALYDSQFMKHFGWTMLASLGPPILYTIARTAHTPRFIDRLIRLPALMLIGLGMSLNSSFAVISGIFKKGGEFNRTPKYNIKGKFGKWTQNKYALPTNPVVYGELALALYALFSVSILWRTTMGRAIAPGMIYYAISFIFMSTLSFIQGFQLQRARQEDTIGPSH